ncbi:ethanolamine kinase [Pseudocercospora fijiensis CIRAD86]|uniref:ethanolamine kinase n=1 Tax=Pseudocercospora fijiensis (strain CIRAD86) TaxID=383855 RepID=N1Q613_PSEFD|nr:ethanolamine kinase [Pseudocercospora fijiensis CIRAD86]EME87554.1 ethanolamine kinase [Pseudocercospora fijiensis CIRAD86]
MASPPNASAAHRADQVDSPLALRHIPITFDTTDPEKSALQLVQEYDRSWESEEGPVHFIRFTDGITNTLMKAIKRRPGLTELQIDQNAILIRAYGKGTDVLIDRERELRAHNLLANLGLAPPLLARFDNGLMYKFIPGHVCSHTDLAKPEIYRQVAWRLGQWHSLPISAIATTPILDSEPETQKLLAPKNGNNTRPHPNTWSVMRMWLQALPQNTDEERERLNMLGTELDWLESKLGNTKGFDGKDFVFAHHDLLCGNVIVDIHSEEEEKPVQFIDYEYATPGPAAFDIANHFAEWAGYDCEHEAVPTKSQRKEFLKHYVASYRYHSISDEDTLTLDIDFQKDLDTLNVQVDLWRGVPGFYWGIWALIQATISQIDFDYVKYAEGRLKEYWSWKEEVTGTRKKEGRDMYVREKKWQSE